MNRLKGALADDVANQIKCGGSVSERATRLFSLKGLEATKRLSIQGQVKGFRRLGHCTIHIKV
jgi:hypothetical protein